MKNVEMKVEHGKLVITVDLTKELGPSSSGKSVIIPPPFAAPKALVADGDPGLFGRAKGGGIIATTEGNVEVPGAPDVKIGLNVYHKKERLK